MNFKIFRLTGHLILLPPFHTALSFTFEIFPTDWATRIYCGQQSYRS